MDEYFDEEAFKIVDEAILQAVNKLGLENRFNLSQIQAVTYDDQEVATANINWAKCEDFSPQVGIDQIEEFVATWDRDTAWLHCIDYLGQEELDYDFKHKYRVRWSIPTRRKPIPRATACVYFSIYVSKIKPKSWPVQVFYVFETNRLIHRPGTSRFREMWLKNLIESKILAMENVDF